MSIASAIATKQQQVADSYTAVSNKGGTLPQTQNLTNLATAISSIPSGSTPVITSLSVTPTTSAQTITAPSGTDGYSPVNVSAVTASIDANITAGNIKKDVSILGVTGSYEGSGGGIGIPREVSQQNVYQVPTSDFTFSLPSGTTDVGNYALAYAFYGCKRLTSIDISSLTTVSGTNALVSTFSGCTGLTSVNLSALTTVSGNYGLYYTFQNCTGLTSVNFSALTTVSGSNGLGNTFYACTGLTSVNFPVLTTVSGNNALYFGFYGCTGITDIYFRALKTTSFGSYTSQFNYMMGGTGTKKTHTLHFPNNLQSKISTLTGYPLFGGTSGKVVLAFDLPATS